MTAFDNHRAPAASRRTVALCAALAISAGLGACAPLVLGGAMVGGAMVASDRRTSGAQLEDQSIELKADARIGPAVGNRGHISVTSYNRSVLLTGEASSEADKAAAEQAVRGIENIRGVVNELAVAGASSMTARSNDTLLTTRVKGALLEAKDLHATAIKVLTERGNVYLMGRVTEREAGRAADVARNVPGVQKVVRVFEVISEAELASLQPKPAPGAASAPR